MKKLILLIAASAIIFCGCEKKEEPNVVVSFDEGEITSLNLLAHFEEMKKIKVFQNKEVGMEDVLEHAVNMELIIKEGIERELHLNPEIREKLHMQMAKIFLDNLKFELVSEISRDSISDEEVKNYYEENKKLYDKPDKYSFYLVNLRNEKEFSKIISDFESKTLTLENIKKNYDAEFKYSKDINFLAPVLKANLEKTKVKNLSDPFDYKNSRYLIYLDEVIKGNPCNFDKKKEYIRNDVLYSKYKKAWQNTYDDLRKKYRVEIDKTAFEKFKKEVEREKS